MRLTRRTKLGMLYVALVVAESLSSTGCSAPAPPEGAVLGTWTVPVRVVDRSDRYSWSSSATLREVSAGRNIILRVARVPISVPQDLKDGWFEPVATLTWGSDPTRVEACDSNGGMRNRLFFRPNSGREVITAVNFGCETSRDGLGDPGDGAFLTITVKSELVN